MIKKFLNFLINYKSIFTYHIMTSQNAQTSVDCFTFKICIIGDAGVGKTTFIKRLQTGEFVTKYDPTLGVDVSTFNLNTNYGVINFLVYDTAGQEKYSISKYYENVKGGILMFDLTSNISFQNCQWFIDEFYKVNNKDVPLIICGNKVDIKNTKVSTKKFSKNFPDMMKYLISAKSCYNIFKPFLELAKIITNHNDLHELHETMPNENIKPPLSEIEKDKIIRDNLLNKYRQHIENIDVLFATGKCTIQKLKTMYSKTLDIICDIEDSDDNMDAVLNDLKRFNNEIIGAIKLLQGQSYSSILEDIEDEQ
jgi:GTP-binding nuclear protein Ran